MSMFAKRHYWAVANTIRQAPVWMGSSEADTLRSVEQMRFLIERFVDLFSRDNPNFKPQRFRDACDGEAQYTVTTTGKRELLRYSAKS